MRNGTIGKRGTAKATLTLCALALWLAALAPAAFAGLPTHPRTAALDVGGLNKACGAAADSNGDLYAASAGESKVKVFDAADHGTPIAEIANANEPCALAVTSAGNLYVSERATGEVVRYKPDAFPLTGAPVYGAREVIDASGEAGGVAVDRFDNRLFVAAGDRIAVYKADGTLEKADLLEGQLTEATGVAAYTNARFAVSNNRRLNLAVADGAGDELEIYTGPASATGLKLRKTITGVDHDEDPGTAEQEFSFGAAGAYLAADPGNENTATGNCTQVQVGGVDQACTQGHFFLHDAGNDAVDEFDATGEFFSQITATGLSADAEPTQVALERSGGASDGTLYVGSGSGAGAELLAFAPVLKPSRTPLPEPFSKVLAGAVAVAVDCEGYVYVAAGVSVRVFSPAGAEVTSFEEASSPDDLAVDCSGHVYVVDSGETQMTYYNPSAYPPSGSTTYARHAPALVTAAGNHLKGVAVNPLNDHAYVLGNQNFAPVVREFGPPSGGSAVAGECGEGLGLANARIDIDVYGKTGNVYVTANLSAGILYLLKCGKEAADGELIREVNSAGGCPNGKWGANPRIAVDQSNGHVVEWANNQVGAAAREYDAVGACVAEFGTFASKSGALYRVALDNSCAIDGLTEQTSPTCAETYPSNGNAYVAYDASNNEVQPFDVTAFGPLEYPEAEGEEEEFTLAIGTDGTGTGTVECKVEGGPAEACEAKYLEGTEVELVPNADVDSEFVEFSGDCGPASCELTMDEDHSVTVVFDLKPVVPKFPLTVATEGTGSGTVTADKGLIACDPVCSDEYAEGTVVVLTATPDPGSIFVSWKKCDTGKVNGRQCTVTVDKAKTVKAVFTTTHALEVSRAGSGLGKVQSTPGGVLCLANCSETAASFKEGTVVTLKQTPAKHFHFVQWLGDCTGSGACEVTMGEDHEVQAEFAEDPKHPLTLSKSGGGQGTVKSSVAGINCGATCSEQVSAYFQGTVVELTATPGKGSAFAGWSGSGCSGTGTCTVTISEAKSVQAEFK